MELKIKPRAAPPDFGQRYPRGDAGQLPLWRKGGGGCGGSGGWETASRCSRVPYSEIIGPLHDSVLVAL